jgi:hypothetical protein
MAEVTLERVNERFNQVVAVREANLNGTGARRIADGNGLCGFCGVFKARFYRREGVAEWPERWRSPAIQTRSLKPRLSFLTRSCRLSDRRRRQCLAVRYTTPERMAREIDRDTA